MLAVVLVGGEGTRLRPLTYQTPKQLLPLVGVPIIECVLAQLARHGVTDAVLALGYLPDRFTAAYPDDVIAGVRVAYSVEDEPLDTAGAIRFAASQAGAESTFVVINGDNVTDLDVSALREFHAEHDAEATIALHAVADPSRFGVVATGDDGRVVEFVEKPPRDLAPSNLVNTGVYIMEPSVLERIAPTGRVSVERETFPAMAAAGRLYALADDSYWLDTGTPEGYLRANADALDGRGGHRAEGVVDGSWRHPSAIVHDAATLRSSVVDARATVGPDAVVEGAVLLPGARVEAGARVRASIVG
ncbi:MAG TPA: NDP-sugar synthase, partial [Acidimicrobiales bacterium]|nr:NDP-sugar synthase [Acidimicrobiales bacterium]